MGYYIEQRGSHFNIPASKVPAAFEAVKATVAANPYDLSWVDKTRVANAPTFEQAMKACRWEISTEPKTGDVYGIFFAGEKCGGDEEVVLNAIAPFVDGGSYIEMQGEENEVWRWYFLDGKVQEVTGTTVFDEIQDPIAVRDLLKRVADYLGNPEAHAGVRESLLADVRRVGVIK
jgi:hypothetical protein